ncbi:MAG: transglutaminase domain-containing protein [Eubacterium sp.]
MKKFFKILSVIILIGALLCGYSYYSGGTVRKTVENLNSREISTSQLQSSLNNKNTDGKSFALQCYSALTVDEQKAFDIIYEGLSSYKQSVYIYLPIEADRIFELATLVQALHPEIFWVGDSFSFASNGKLTFNYPYTRNETEEKNRQLEQKADEIYSQINPSGSDFEKALAIFDYIAKNTSYNSDAIGNLSEYPEVSTIEGVFMNNSAVCGGYSKAYQYLLLRAGIDAVTVSGKAVTADGNGNHAWVALTIDGENYYSDVTWADGFDNSEKSSFVNHTYFLMGADDIKNSHFRSDCYNFIDCTSSTDKYYINQNLYFEKYNLSSVRTAIKNEFEKNSPAAELKFAEKSEYQKAQSSLFDFESIYLILKTIDPFSTRIDTEKVSYNCNDDYNVIIIFFTPK